MAGKRTGVVSPSSALHVLALQRRQCPRASHAASRASLDPNLRAAASATAGCARLARPKGRSCCARVGGTSSSYRKAPKERKRGLRPVDLLSQKRERRHYLTEGGGKPTMHACLRCLPVKAWHGRTKSVLEVGVLLWASLGVKVDKIHVIDGRMPIKLVKGVPYK